MSINITPSLKNLNMSIIQTHGSEQIVQMTLVTGLVGAAPTETNSNANHVSNKRQ
jgi:hypothetical protein